jgi:hypothetical protein
MDGRVVLGKHHVRASLQDPQVAGHGLGRLAQVRRGDHVEHCRSRGGDRNTERAQRPQPTAPAGVQRQLAGNHQVVTQSGSHSGSRHR